MSAVIRRVLDASVSAVGLVLLSPVLAVVAVLVRVRHGTPVLFRQMRAGKDGAPFELIKFRTMTDERDSGGGLLPDEDRLTSLGQFLRSTSLDELPELWLVLRGEMALVGPRPLPVTYLERYTPDQARRCEVKPGITGWAQVNGRNAVTWDRRLAMDVWYVENRSLWLDVRILWRTLEVVVKREGISAEGAATMAELPPLPRDGDV